MNDATRNRAARRRVPAVVAAPAAALRRTRVLRAIDSLDESDRLVLSLEMCDGLATTEIAAILELTPRAVMRRREHALTAIRRGVAGDVRPSTRATDALRSAM